MANPLLAVKFFIPRPRPNLTERESLLQRFEAGLQNPLTLISAPAGFGKSTLVSIWIDRQKKASNLAGFPWVAWLSLEEADNDPFRFWAYVITALRNSSLPGG